MKKIYFVWLLSFAVFPFFQGGYFYFESLGFGLIQCICLVAMSRKERIYMSLAGFRRYYVIIFGCALLSSFSAVDIGMHLIGIVKLMVPLLFLVVYDSFKTYFAQDELQKNISILKEMTHVSIIAGTIMALCVIFCVAFFTRENPLLTYFVQKNRIGGFIQYANTFALYLFALSVLANYTLKQMKFKLPIMGILSCGIYLTQSRGTLVLFGMYVFVMLFLCFVPIKATRKSGVAVVAVIIVGSVLGQLVVGFSDIGFDKGRNMAISLNESEWLTRVMYYTDSMKLLLENPLGYGHLGYYYIQRSVQTGAAYLIKYVHSSILQMGLDYGILAMLALILFGSYGGVAEIGRMCKRGLIKQSVSVKMKEKSLFAAGMLLVFVHTWIDFDLEYSVVLLLIILGQLLLEEKQNQTISLEQEKVLTIPKARVTGITRYKTSPITRHKTRHKTSPITEKIQCVSFLLVILSGLFGYFSYVTYLEYVDKSFDAYAMYPLYTQAVDGILTDEAIPDREKIAEKAITRNEYYIKGVAFLAEYDYNNNKIEASLQGFKRLVELAPLWFNYLERYAFVALKYSETSYLEGHLTSQNGYLNDVITLSSYVNELEKVKRRNLDIKNAHVFIASEKLKDIERKGRLLYDKIQGEPNE